MVGRILPLALLVLLLTAAPSAAADGPNASAAAWPASPAAAAAGPDTLDLPDGFQPEGIAVTADGMFYVGSIPTGDIYEGDVETGEGGILVDAPDGRAAIGLDEHRGLLYVAGGPTGQALVYDRGDGSEVASYQLTDAETFVNDVVVTPQAAYFTDSLNPVLYRVPLDAYGRPGSPDDVTVLELTGDLVYTEGFNVNGIDATASGRTLIVVQSNTGRLFRVDAGSGATTAIGLGDEDVTNGDGVLLVGKTLYVVQNRLNQVAVVDLAPNLSSGEVVERLTDDRFDVPTTVAAFEDRLYLVNARFDTEPEPETSYAVVVVDVP